MALVNEVALAIVPVPLDVHIMPALFVADEPAVIFTAPALEQVVTAVPATAVADGVTLTVTEPMAVFIQPIPLV